MSSPQSPPPSAVTAAILAFGSWGVLPIYWKALSHLGSDLAMAHRVVWTMATVIPLLLFRREWGAWLAALRQPAILGRHLWAALLLGINWGIFVWSAQHGHILDSSLGYFINPLLNVLLGRFLLGERLSTLQFWSVLLAAIGVSVQIFMVGRIPWIGLILAFSFAFYGLARRQSPLGSLPGLGVETLLSTPFALAYMIWLGTQNTAFFGNGTWTEISLIVGLGIITTIPLLAFVFAARHLPFSLLGLLQFLAPTGQFLVGAFLYHESIRPEVLASFALIWLGVILFCTDLWLRRRLSSPLPASDPSQSAS